MPNPVLIAYATRSGSTYEVAEAIAAALHDGGWRSEVVLTERVQSVAGRPAVILGAPLYCGRLPKEFHQFLTRYRQSLEPLRPWCFILGPTRNERADFEGARRQAERQLARHNWLHIAELQIFGGRWDVGNLPFPFSMARRIPGNPLSRIPASDVRDWPAIRAWALGIAEQIKSAA